MAVTKEAAASAVLATLKEAAEKASSSLSFDIDKAVLHAQVARDLSEAYRNLTRSPVVPDR